MHTVSFVDTFIAQNPQHIHKLKAKDSTGRWAYYFVFVRPHVEKLFREALTEEKKLNLEDYGVVVDSCYGDKPDPPLIARLHKKYGFNV